MKRFLVLFSSLLLGANIFANNADNENRKKNINEQLLRSFNEQFPKAEQVKWEESGDGYSVNFVEEGVRSHIVYDKEGAFVSSVRYYQERTLPYYLLNILKKRFTGKAIFSVTEISTVSNIEYDVKLEDARTWLTVRVGSEGNLEVVEKYRKAS